MSEDVLISLREHQLDRPALPCVAILYVACQICHRIMSLKDLSRPAFNSKVTSLCLPARMGTRTAILRDAYCRRSLAALQTTNMQAVSCFYWQWDLYQDNWSACSLSGKSTLICYNHWAIHPSAPGAQWAVTCQTARTSSQTRGCAQGQGDRGNRPANHSSGRGNSAAREELQALLSHIILETLEQMSFAYLSMKTFRRCDNIEGRICIFARRVTFICFY